MYRLSYHYPAMEALLSNGIDTLSLTFCLLCLAPVEMIDVEQRKRENMKKYLMYGLIGFGIYYIVKHMS